MLRIHRVRPDVNAYGWLAPAPGETAAGDELIFDGQPRAMGWRPLHARGQPGGKPPADFLKLGHGALVLSPRAVEVTRHVLERCGELLPVHRAGEQYRLLNVTRVVDCLDHQATEWKYLGGRRLYPLRFAFHLAALPAVPVFKVEELARERLFSLDGRFARDLELKALVEDHGLTGLVFEEVWAAGEVS